MAPVNGNDFERTDVEPWLLCALGVGVAAFLGLTPLGLALAYRAALHQPSTSAPPGIARAAPRLQTDSVGELASLRRAEHERLSGYGWIDREQHTVHVPIGRAMSLVHQRGLSGWRQGP